MNFNSKNLVHFTIFALWDGSSFSNGTIGHTLAIVFVFIRELEDITCTFGRRSLSEYNFNIAKTARKVGRPKRKSITQPQAPQPVPKRTRNRYPIGIKKKVIALHKEGMSLKAIGKWLRDNEKLDIKPGTICTWYNTENVSRMDELGDLGATNNDTCISKQRPRILVDTETILNIHVRRSQENGLPLSLQAASIAGTEVYVRLKALGIYKDNGQRLVRTDALTESYINFILHRNERDVEVTDVNDPHYEDPHTEDTNAMIY